MGHHIDHHFDHIIELTRLGYAEIYMGNALADYAEARLTDAGAPAAESVTALKSTVKPDIESTVTPTVNPHIKPHRNLS